MNKSNIEWTEYTSNPIRGKCLHQCSYCYAERIRKRFNSPETIAWIGKELTEIEKRKMPSTIFVGSMHDIFGRWVMAEMIQNILDTACRCTQHTFLFLTKNPQRYHEFQYPDNCWLGETITGNSVIDGTMPPGDKKFISFEPLMSACPPAVMEGYSGIIVGAMTGPKAVLPKIEWVKNIVDEAQMRNIPVFLKDNLLTLFPELPKLQQLPW